jgi:hypothetical protein
MVFVPNWIELPRPIPRTEIGRGSARCIAAAAKWIIAWIAELSASRASGVVAIRMIEDAKLDAPAGEACIVRRAEERDFWQWQAGQLARKRACDSIDWQQQSSQATFFGSSDVALDLIHVS